jgi:hypothetical protein
MRYEWGEIMKIKIALFILALLGTSLSCNFASKIMSSGSGPQNLTAELTAPDVVKLNWDAVEGAVGYVVEVSFDGGESFPVITLDSKYTNYEHLTAPEKTKLHYQVQVLSDSGVGGKSSVDIETAERMPNPLTVNPSYDTENSVSTVIGEQGGILSLVDADGIEYTLKIPQQALSSNTEIRMTPVREIQDWPLDGDGFGAVKLEPEGLILNDVATLSIGIPYEVDPNLSIVGFANQSTGEEFHLAYSSVEESTTGKTLPGRAVHLASPSFKPKIIIVSPVVEFKVHGAGQTSGNNASRLVKENAPSKSGDAVQQKQTASKVTQEELAPLSKEKLDGTEIPGKAEAYEIAKSIYNAENCKQLNSQVVAYQQFLYRRPDANATLDQQIRNDKIVKDELKKKMKEILESTADECEKADEEGRSADTDSGCAKELWNKLTNPAGRGLFWQNMNGLMSGEFSASEVDAINEKLDKCKKKAYFISGDIDEAHMQGYTCDSSKPFRIGGTLIFDFVPTGENMGTYTYTGPFNATGVGPYLIRNDGTMKISGYGCIDSFFGQECAEYDHIWTAEPIDPEQCVP